MYTEKQKWVEEVLASADNITRVQPVDLTDNVLGRIASGKQYSISPKDDKSLIWKIAASVIFISLMNALTIYNYQTNLKRSFQASENRETESELGIGVGSNDPGTVIFGK